MKQMSLSSYSLIAIMVIALVVIAMSLGMPFSSRLLPLSFSIIIFILSALKLWQELSSRDKAEKAVTGSDVGTTEASQASGRRFLLAFGWVASFVLAIYLLGFLAAVPLFNLIFMKFHGTRWRTSILFAVIILAIMYSGFELGLDITLYRGVLFNWLDR
jgi:hypothetical protein